MKCIPCDKVFMYPVVDRKGVTALCPLCFGSNLSDVTAEELNFARNQRWHYDERTEELRVTMVVVPDDLYTEGSWWIGFALHEGGKFQLHHVGTEAEADRRIEEYKLSGGKMPLALKGMPGMYEEAQVFYAVKLRASEAFRLVPRASEVIDMKELAQ